MGFTADEIILMYHALQLCKEEIDNELDDINLSVKEHNETLNVSKICNGLMRKIKRFASENNVLLGD